MYWRQSNPGGSLWPFDSVATIRAWPKPETVGVAGQLGDMSCGSRHTPQQVLVELTRRIRQTVKMPLSFGTNQNQTRLSQVGQVSRDGRLWQVEDSDQIADAELPLAQQIEDPQPRPVGQRPKGPTDIELFERSAHIRLREYSGCLKSAPTPPAQAKHYTHPPVYIGILTYYPLFCGFHSYNLSPRDSLLGRLALSPASSVFSAGFPVMSLIVRDCRGGAIACHLSVSIPDL